MRPRFKWDLGNRALALGERTLIMGVLNVTPDSFSDGGRFLKADDALRHALELLDNGADLIDIGGESTRPGTRVQVSSLRTSAVSVDEELSRVIPVIERIRQERPDAVVSIDTYKAQVARDAIRIGAEIVNDVSGLAWDEQMAGTVAELGCGTVLMHTRGTPEEWRSLGAAQDIVGEVMRGLRESVAKAEHAGVRTERIVVDPGFGFGKRYDENYPLLAHFESLHELGLPVLAGPSRKSFLGRTAGRKTGGDDLPADQRLNATIAAVVASVLKGAHIIRVHDVKPVVEAVSIADAVLSAE